MFEEMYPKYSRSQSEVSDKVLPFGALMANSTCGEGQLKIVPLRAIVLHWLNGGRKNRTPLVEREPAILEVAILGPP